MDLLNLFNYKSYCQTLNFLYVFYMSYVTLAL